MKIRQFTREGLETARQLLEQIRTDKVDYSEKVKELVFSEVYTKGVKCKIHVDQDKVFSTKLDIAQYFLAQFEEGGLNKYREDVGIWTWLALLYYPQLKATKKKVEYCWIYDVGQMRFSRQHFIAGPTYLYQDLKGVLGEDGEAFLFSEAPITFGGLIDQITHKPEFVRIPAMLKIATWLYYDPKNKKRIKSNAGNRSYPGSLFQLERIAEQFAMTYDIFNVEDASKLWNLLPDQFDRFKDGIEH